METIEIQQNSIEYAKKMDNEDPLKQYRNEFYIPKHNGEDTIYFCGNSLGLQPKNAQKIIQEELDAWKKYGVEGHFKGERPWMYYHHNFKSLLAEVVGAKPNEVGLMNSLTTNLHLLMVSFYQPTDKKYKILMEGGAFPSDQYAMETQAKVHGYNPDDAIIELTPKTGEHTLSTEDILTVIEDNKDELAIIMIGAVNYYTGQYYDLEKITAKAKEYNITVGFDCAHAAGNVVMKLHEWNVDFAVWCSYKYLNSGPGGPSGFFVNEKHGDNKELKRFAGWWGHDEKSRFLMKKGFSPMSGADGWQLSNAQVFAMAPHLAAIEWHSKAGMKALSAKSKKLTAYLEQLLMESDFGFEIITPKNKEDRGAQLSILTGNDGKALFEFLTDKGVIADWREPNVIRVAPVPMYNSFEDVFKFVSFIKQYYAQ